MSSAFWCEVREWVGEREARARRREYLRAAPLAPGFDLDGPWPRRPAVKPVWSVFFLSLFVMVGVLVVVAAWLVGRMWW